MDLRWQVSLLFLPVAAAQRQEQGALSRELVQAERLGAQAESEVLPPPKSPA